MPSEEAIRWSSGSRRARRSLGISTGVESLTFVKSVFPFEPQNAESFHRPGAWVRVDRRSDDGPGFGDQKESAPAHRTLRW
ncbi:hypothetical protein GCM10009706_12990 [Curtobacterium citreum]|nr:hypothetical protein GCM10009706_12990 [Curtobacterium citreum]